MPYRVKTNVKKIIKFLLSDEVIAKMKSLLYRKNNIVMLKKLRRISALSNKAEYPGGINLIGDIKAETGLGQSMRILAYMLQKEKIPFCIIQSDSPVNLKRNDETWSDKVCEIPEYAINLIHINLGDWAEFYNKSEDSLFANRYNIAFWLWELEVFPKEWIPCTATVDEIWTPSEFISKSVRKITGKPVLTMPYVIDIPEKIDFKRDYFNLPAEKFLFLIMYDFKSVSERKNPIAAVKAYIEAFPAEAEVVGLIIKINHLEKTEQLNELKKQLCNYQNLYFITDNLSRNEVESLIANSDVLVSLHRSEGYGLPLAEAMYRRIPVIATAWSANREFMDESSACLVDYKLIQIEKTIGPYKKGNRWAEADIKQASGFMQRLFKDRKYYEQTAQNGRTKIDQTNKMAAKNLQNRIGFLLKNRKEIK